MYIIETHSDLVGKICGCLKLEKTFEPQDMRDGIYARGKVQRFKRKDDYLDVELKINNNLWEER